MIDPSHVGPALPKIPSRTSPLQSANCGGYTTTQSIMSCPLYCGGNRFSPYLLPCAPPYVARPTYMMHLVPALDGCHSQGKSPKADAAAYTVYTRSARLARAVILPCPGIKMRGSDHWKETFSSSNRCDTRMQCNYLFAQSAARSALLSENRIYHV